MKSEWGDFFRRHKWLGALLSYCYLPVLLVPVLLTRTWREIDRDEGVNLIKSLLVERGFVAHRDFWSDQPPFYPQLLAAVTHFFPGSLDLARIGTTLLVGLLFWSLYQMMALHRGPLAGLLGVLLFGACEHVLRYSGALMIGMPCLTFGLLSLLAANLSVHRRAPYLGFVAGAFGVFSVATKFYGALFAIPVFVLILQARREQAFLFRFLAFGALGVVSAFAWVSYLSPGIIGSGVSELFESHLDAEEMDVPVGFRRLRALLSNDLLYLSLAVIGLSSSRRSRYLFQPIALFLIGAVFLYFHRPVWNHHYPLLALPLSMLAVEGVLRILELLRKFRRFGSVGILLFGALFALKIGRDTFLGRLRIQGVGYRLAPELVPLLKSHLGDDGLLFTDRPIYAYLSSAKVPPAQAVLTTKRLRTGDILQEEILRGVREVHPKLILLDRFPKLRVFLLSALAGEYEPIWRKDEAVLLLRRPENKR